MAHMVLFCHLVATRKPDEAVYLKASFPHHSGAGETIACSLDPRGFRKGECARKHKQESLTSRSGGEESAAAGSRAACSLAGAPLWSGRAAAAAAAVGQHGAWEARGPGARPERRPDRLGAGRTMQRPCDGEKTENEITLAS